MKFKEYFLHTILPGFFASVTCISFVMAVIGSVFEPDARLGYDGLFWPLLYGLLGALAQLVGFSPREMTVRQAFMRNVLTLVLLEAVVMGVLYLGGALTNAAITISLAVGILVIYAAVSVVLWLNDRRTADQINQALGELQRKNQDI